MQPNDTTTGSGSVDSGPSSESRVPPGEIAGGPESTGMLFINSVDWMKDLDWLRMRRDALRERIDNAKQALAIIDRAIGEAGQRVA